MMDAVVQFVRNALCTAKNFNYLGDTFLYDPAVTAQYYAFPSPLDKTTPLEIFIACTQFYACVTITVAGCGMVARGGIGKLRLITRLVDLLAKDEKKEKDKKEEKGTTATWKAKALVNQSLVHESDHAARSAFVGLLLLGIGPSFFWLFANSLHVTETDWIGGFWGLIHALTIMELALVAFLYYMWKDAGRALGRARRMEALADAVETKKEGKLSDADVARLDAEEYGWIAPGGWSPFWTTGTSSPIVAAEGRMLEKEEEAVASRLASFAAKGLGPDVVDDLRRAARRARLEGYREYLYLLLNALAFYGYLACVVTAYFDDEEAKPGHVRAVLLGMTNGDADWLGNAVGDFAWTVEPVIMLGSPMLLNSMTARGGKKVKVA